MYPLMQSSRVPFHMNLGWPQSRAEMLNGMLNYGMMFRMEAAFEDGTKRSYVLNVPEKEGEKALLVDLADSGQGYSLPPKRTNELRSVIFNRQTAGGEG